MIRYYVKQDDKIYDDIEHLMARFNVSNEDELSTKIYNDKYDVYLLELSKLKCFTDKEDKKDKLVYSYKTYVDIKNIILGGQDITSNPRYKHKRQ